MRYSYTLSVIFLIFLIVFPLILMVFACRNSNKIKEDSYKNRCGALFEGFSLNKKVYPKSILVHPVLFFGRRIVVVLTAVKLGGFLWAQLTIHISTSLLTAAYELYFKPLASPRGMRMEIMNECTILILCYLLFCFTEFVPDPSVRYQIGIAYNVVVLINIAIHTVMLVWDSLANCKLYCKKQVLKKKAAKLVQNFAKAKEAKVHAIQIARKNTVNNQAVGIEAQSQQV